MMHIQTLLQKILAKKCPDSFMLQGVEFETDVFLPFKKKKR